MNNGLSIDQLMQMKLSVIDEAIAAKKIEPVTVAAEPVVIPQQIKQHIDTPTATIQTDLLDNSNRKLLVDVVEREINNCKENTIVTANTAAHFILKEFALDPVRYFEHAQVRAAAYAGIRRCKKAGVLVFQGRNNYIRTNKGQPARPADIGATSTNPLESIAPKKSQKDWDNKHLWKSQMIHMMEEYPVPSSSFEPKDIIESLIRMRLVKNIDEHVAAARRMLDKLFDCLLEDKVIEQSGTGRYKKIGHFRLDVGYVLVEPKKKSEVAAAQYIKTNPDFIRPQVHTLVQCLLENETKTTTDFVDLCDWSECSSTTLDAKRQLVRKILKELAADGLLIEMKSKGGQVAAIWKKPEKATTLQ